MTGGSRNPKETYVMLNHPTLEKLRSLKLTGMLHAFEEQLQMSDIAELSFEERLGLLADRESTTRENRRQQTRLRQAKLKVNAAVEDIDFRTPRGIDKSLMASLLSCKYISQHINCLICGPTGIGKTWIACALAQKACREGYKARYIRLPRFLQELNISKADGRYPKLLAELEKTDLLILDDWGIMPLSGEHRRDLLEILDDRFNRRSTIVTSQLPVKSWHEYIDDPTMADAILDRLVHSAYRINLDGDSMRKIMSKLTTTAPVE
jgi:DNA replication protein DnaC